jgi:hypothetical protein
LALLNLRAIVILTVLGFHSLLACLIWIPAVGVDFASPLMPTLFIWCGIISSGAV